MRIGIQIGSDRGYGGSRGSYGRDNSRIAFDNGYRDGLRRRIEAYRLSISRRGRNDHRWDDRGRNNRTTIVTTGRTAATTVSS